MVTIESAEPDPARQARLNVQRRDAGDPLAIGGVAAQVSDAALLLAAVVVLTVLHQLRRSPSNPRADESSGTAARASIVQEG